MRSFILAVAIISVLSLPISSAEIPYRDAALEAARWIRASAIQTGQGIVWPADPRDTKSIDNTLYAGTSGVVLFLIEASRSTGDQTFMKDARAGADHMLATLASEKEPGLYTGIAGTGFALTEAFKATGDVKYRDGARQCARLLEDRAKKAGKGIEWNDTTDIVSGGAGIGLFLLYAARELNEPALRGLATQVAYRLIELARTEKNGLKWAMSPTFARLMPNFSHGTAGIAYFLATLYRETKQREFLDAALAGAKYLQAVAKMMVIFA